MIDQGQVRYPSCGCWEEHGAQSQGLGWGYWAQSMELGQVGEQEGWDLSKMIDQGQVTRQQLSLPHGSYQQC
jgi:hypothetical protein